MANSKIKRLLGAIESDNNPDAIHKLQKEGIHANTRAIGQYGIMPITAQEMATKNKGDVLDNIVVNAEPEAVEQILKDNPDKQDELVNKLLEKASKNSKGDLVNTLVRWKHGQNLTNDKVKAIKGRDEHLMNRIEDKLIEQSTLPSAIDNEPYTIPSLNEAINKPYKKPVLQSFPKLKRSLK